MLQTRTVGAVTRIPAILRAVLEKSVCSDALAFPEQTAYGFLALEIGDGLCMASRVQPCAEPMRR